MIFFKYKCTYKIHYSVGTSSILNILILNTIGPLQEHAFSNKKRFIEISPPIHLLSNNWQTYIKKTYEYRSSSFFKSVKKVSLWLNDEIILKKDYLREKSGEEKQLYIHLYMQNGKYGKDL